MKKFIEALVAFVVVVALGVGLDAWWLSNRFVNDRALPKLETTVIVPAGTSGRDVAARLAAAGVIASPRIFELEARLRREQDAMRAGAFRFAPHQTAADVLRQLVTGGDQLARWVAIPEGYTNAQIAATYAANGFASDAALLGAFAGHIELGGVRTPSLEGYLFPSTYLVPRSANPTAIASEMVAQFRRELPPDAEARARALGFTVPEVVAVASLVEREGKADSERPLIAGVIYNRLRLGMPLQVDASLEYAFPAHKTVITERDLRVDSPYNTYEHTGLPPTPIANPGKASLDAAFAPRSSQYLYYVYMGNGHHAFARTLAEHNANVTRYLR